VTATGARSETSMYVPSHFAESDVTRLHALMRAGAFATLASVMNGAPFAAAMELLP